MAARILESCGLPGVTALASVLHGERDCSCAPKRGSVRCGIAALASVSDRVAEIAGGKPLTLPHVTGPLLLAAPLHLAARRLGLSFALTWDGVDVWCTRDGIGYRRGPVEWPATGGNIRIGLDPSPAKVQPVRARGCMIAEADWRRLEKLAAATLVPESAASRAKGAGPDG